MCKKISMLFPNGLGKALTFSFDDGVWQDVKLMEIFDQYGVKGTFNLSSGLFEIVNHHGRQYPRLTREEAIKVYTETPHEVAVHGYTHPQLQKLSPQDVAWQISEDRENLESDYGTTIRGMAYPFGTYDENVIEIARNCGIVYARTIQSTYGFDLPADWLELHPTCHYNDPMLMQLAERFLNEDADTPQLFYLWGHAFEFDSFQNWSVIENFCERVGCRDDIWYATNIEICDYVRAYDRLEWSADRSMVYNPTAYKIWFRYCVNDKTMIASVASGRMISIFL